MEPLKSPADAKSYKYLKLANGLSVLLIHDPAVAKALKAGAEAAEQQDGQEAADGDGSSMSEGSDGSSSDGEDDDTSGSGEEGSDGEGSDGEAAAAKGKQGKKAVASGSKKAAAAMAVSVGSFSDPVAMQGLSHYLEHMLFMGSSKFPDENDYDAFLTRHGGSSNAFTELEFTNYHFDVAAASLHGALDRFAQFFVAPLFQADSLEREVLAVDSEFAGVQQSDHSRLVQLMCHTSKSGHVFNKFSWGNKASLWDAPHQAGLDVRQHIIDYYRREYGAERMALVLLGGQELEQLEAWVRELFEPVPRGVAGPAASFAAAGPPFEGRLLYVAPAVKDHHEISVTFQLPCLRAAYANKPDHYISHLVGHEGPGSLLSALKARGWALELCAGVDDDGYSANSAAYLFTVNIVLTEAGLAAGPGCGLAPVALLFQFLRLLRQAGPQQWVWEELKSIADMKWRFVEEEDSLDLVTRLASGMAWVEPEHLLVAEYLHTAWQPDKVLELLSAMDPESSSYRIDLLTRSFPQVKQQLLQPHESGSSAPPSSSPLAAAAAAGLQQLSEPWFKLDALAVPLPAALTAAWASEAISDDLALPPRNPYIPSDFSLKATPPADAAAPSKAAKQQQCKGDAMLEGVDSWMLLGGPEMRPSTLLAAPPKMLLDEPGLRMWHKLAVGYGQPRAVSYFRLSGPAAAASPAAAVLGALWLRLVEEALAEDSYLADVAGLHWSSSSDGPAGFEVRLDGFSHKLELLIGRVFDALAAAKVKEGSFAAMHEQLLRRYRNAMLSPSKAAGALRLHCLAGNAHWSSDQLAEALQQVKGPQEVQAFAAEFLKCCHVEGLMMGNVTAAEASGIAHRLRHDILPAGGEAGLLAAADRPQQVCVRLPDGCELLHKSPVRNPEEDNCCVEVYYQIGMSSDLRLRVLTDLVDQLLFEPLYDALRTKQQLGYTVSSGARLTHGVCGFCVVVVSAAFAPAEVEARIEAFLTAFEATLKAVPQEEFERHKAALASNKLQQDTALSQEGERAWEQVASTRYEFVCKEQEAALLAGVSLDEVVTFYAAHLSPASPVRRKLCVQVVPLSGGGNSSSRQADAAEQQQQPQSHVQHDGPHQQHLVGTVVVRAGAPRAAAAAAAATSQDGEPDAASDGHVPAAAVAATSSAKQLPAAKRRKQQQQQEGAPGGGQQQGSGDARRVTMFDDVDALRAGLERFAPYCTVRPVLAAVQ